jgi:glycosyltransferase involved in cell wall biosynthesis
MVDSELNQIFAERDLLAGQLAQVSKEKEMLAGQLAQIISERNILKDQLNDIYLSNFWKMAKFYYRVKESLFRLGRIHKGLKDVNRKIIDVLFLCNLSKIVSYINIFPFGKKYEGLRIPRYHFSQTYPKIELADILRLGKGNQGLVIYPPTIDWNHTLFQRPHHIMLGMARKGFSTIFCTPNQIDSIKWDFVTIEKNLFLCSNLNTLLRLSERKDLFLYISNTMHKPLIEKLRPAKVIYDYIDELEVFSNYDSEMVITHEELVKTADVVLVTADRLSEKIQKIRKDVILCPNAVDYSHFADAQMQGPRPFDFQQRGLNSRPIIGYYGALAEWIDYDLLVKAARMRPNYDFVLIGLDYDGSFLKSKAKTMPNIHYFGPKKYIELPQYLRYFDVAIIPFKLNKISHSTSPLKLFEYMSALKPVVTTAMDELKKYSCIFIAPDSDEFVNLLDKALLLKTDMQYREKLRQEALKNTWDRRVDTIIQQIKQPRSQYAIIESNK